MPGERAEIEMQFTAHNIRLPDGTETWPQGPLLEEFGTFFGRFEC
jgi:hypothetical protein